VTWPVLIEVWSTEVLAFVPDLPGLQVTGTSPTDAFTSAESAAPHYLRWLIEGEMLPESARIQPLLLTETRKAEGVIGPFFNADDVVPDPDAIELSLTVGRAALSDLLFIRDDVPPDRLSEVDRILRHIAELDRWYATRIADAHGSAFPSIEDELIHSASLFEETIDAVLDRPEPVSWERDGERWSVAKVLRRRTGHLREHLPEIMAHLG
jgi:predicted RNase H-like HicB family nuclease